MDGGRNNSGRGYHQNQGGRGNNQSQPNQGGGRGWADPPAGGSSQQPSPQQPLGNRPPIQVNQPPPQQAWGNRPQAPQQSGPSTAAPTTAKPGAWGPSTPPTPIQSQPPPPPQASHQPSADDLDIRNLKISEEKSQNDQIEVIRSVKPLVNHFPVRFNSNSTIFHYDVDVMPCNDNGLQKKKLRKSELSMIKDKLFAEDDRLKACALFKTVYDSDKNIFSAVQLPTGTFNVEIQEGEDVKRVSYTFTIKLVNELKLLKLNDYLRGNCSFIPRDILQGMDLVMKDNPSRRRIGVGQSFYSNEYYNNDDLSFGIAEYRGFQQSLKPTSRGLTLCLDYSVTAFRKPWPVLDFLKENVRGLNGFNDVKKFVREVYKALRGLKVMVTHRRTKQKYIIRGLSDEDACDVYVDQIDPEGVNPPIRTSLVDYFREKWGKNIQYPNIPCLELGRKSNKVPMEFCVLVEGQRFPNFGRGDDVNHPVACNTECPSIAEVVEVEVVEVEVVEVDDLATGKVIFHPVDHLYTVEEPSSFWICAIISSFIDDWWYLACTKCHQKLVKNDNIYYCSECKKSYTSGIYRYKVRLEVLDSTANASVLCWDREAEELIGRSCHDLRVEFLENRKELPDDLVKLIGQTALFKVLVRDEQIYNESSAFSVSRVVTEPILVAMYNKWPLEDDNESDFLTLVQGGIENGMEADLEDEVTTPIKNVEAVKIDEDSSTIRKLMFDEGMDSNSLKKLRVLTKNGMLVR